MTKTLNTTPIVVPEAVRRKAGLRRGEEVEFRVSGRAITIMPKKIKRIEKRTESVQEQLAAGYRANAERDRATVSRSDDALTPEEAKIVRRGEAQLKKGQSKPWRTIKNALPR